MSFSTFWEGACQFLKGILDDAAAALFIRWFDPFDQVGTGKKGFVDGSEKLLVAMNSRFGCFIARWSI